MDALDAARVIIERVADENLRESVAVFLAMMAESSKAAEEAEDNQLKAELEQANARIHELEHHLEVAKVDIEHLETKLKKAREDLKRAKEKAAKAKEQAKDPKKLEKPVEVVEKKPKEVTTEKRRGRKPVDTGKIRALYQGGRSVAWIADDMNIAEATVRKHLREMGLTEGR